jgi:hypothetical protein
MYWTGSLYKESGELSTSCHEHPLNTSLFCQTIVVETLQSLAAEFDIDICRELPRFSSLTPQLREEHIRVTRQVSNKIDCSIIRVIGIALFVVPGYPRDP